MLNLFSATMMRDYTEHIGHILAVTSLLILLEVSRAFQPGINDRIGSGNENANADQQAGMSPVIERALRILPEGKGPFGGGDDDDQTTLVDVDLDQAQDFANHFGKYSYEQIERMRNDLHTHRVQSMLSLGEDNPSNDVLFLERFIEDDLTSQLEALREDMPDPYLFRYPDKDVGVPKETNERSPVSPASTETTGATEKDARKKNKKETDNNKFDLFQKLLKDGVLESMAICIVLGYLMMAPQQVA
mmetsp:Transcript_23535/g.52153  ORF Transcript_23535/g.52153 Transcript_23535/m.52153 type:complete len:246 (+) Transcript_23535:265-1002(+)